METSALFDDITLQQSDDGTVTGAFGRCTHCDAYQWLGFDRQDSQTQVWCPSCNRRETVRA